MSSTFLTLRYVGFALLILFNSVICILAALNLGSLVPNTQKFPQVDAYLIFSGAVAVALIFPVIFIELFRKNAFLSRVAVEIIWVSLLWVMSLSGAAAITAIAPEMHCDKRPNVVSGVQLETTCQSVRALVAFTWLSTLTFLSYLFGLVVSAAIHSQDNSNVWATGVRDFQWYTQRKAPTPSPDPQFNYGKLVDPREPSYLAPVYSQQPAIGAGYQVEHLKIEQTVQYPVAPRRKPPPPADPHMREFQFPARPTPAALPRIDTDAGDAYRPLPVPAATKSKPPQQAPYSLYPQFVQASGGHIAQPPKRNEPSPPPAGAWPRQSPQEPIRKSRPSPKTNAPSAYPTTERAEPQSAGPSSATSPTGPRRLPARPTGPRHVSIDRPRPPPLDVSLANSQQ